MWWKYWPSINQYLRVSATIHLVSCGYQTDITGCTMIMLASGQVWILRSCNISIFTWRTIWECRTTDLLVNHHSAYSIEQRKLLSIDTLSRIVPSHAVKSHDVYWRRGVTSWRHAETYKVAHKWNCAQWCIIPKVLDNAANGAQMPLLS